MGPEAMKRTVFHVQGNDAYALSVLHNKIQREVLDEKICVVTERLTIERMQ